MNEIHSSLRLSSSEFSDSFHLKSDSTTPESTTPESMCFFAAKPAISSDCPEKRDISSISVINSDSSVCELISTSVSKIFENQEVLTEMDLLDIQIKSLDRNLADYHYDFDGIPNQLTRELIKFAERIQIISLDRIFTYADWPDRIRQLQSKFKGAKLKINESDFEKQKKDLFFKEEEKIDLEFSHEKEFVFFKVSSQSALPIYTRRHIYTSLRSTPIDSKNLPLPPSPIPSIFPLSFDRQIPRENIRKNGRAIISELANTSISLGIVTFKDGILYSNTSDTILGDSFECKELRSRCEAHLSNRLQLLYVLALSCYKTKKYDEVILTESSTAMQVGVGGHKHLEAAHSAILTNLNIGISRESIEKLALNPLKFKAIVSEYNLDEEKIREFIDKTNLKSLKKDDSRLSVLSTTLIPYESDFGQNLNSTVKLPSFCNQLDVLCEEGLRHKLIDEINKCYKGLIHPADVFNFFVRELTALIKEYKKKLIIECQEIDLQKEVKREIELLANYFESSFDKKVLIKKIALVFFKAFDVKLPPVRNFSAEYEKMVGKSIDNIKQDLCECIKGAEKFLNTEFADLHTISDCEVAPILREIKKYLSSLLPLELEDYLNLDWPQSLGIIEDENYPFDHSCKEELAFKGFNWLKKLIFPNIRTKKIFLISNNTDLDDFLVWVRPFLIDSQNCFNSPRNVDFKNQQIDLINLYLKILEDAPNLLKILNTKEKLAPETGIVERVELTDADINEAQRLLIEKKHDLNVLDTQVFLPPADYLNELIYYSIERTIDSKQYPDGLKIKLNKPQYFSSAEFKVKLVEHFKHEYSQKLSLRIGDKKSGFFWI